MRDTLVFERYWPTAIGLGSAIAFYYTDLTITSAIGKELFAAVLSAASVCAGFLTTALTVLMSLGSTEIGKRLRATNSLDDLFNYLKHAIVACLITSLLCIIGFFFFNGENPGVGTVASSTFVGATVFSGCCIWRIVPILLSIMRKLSEPEDKQG
jgi:hypothetical protein